MQLPNLIHFYSEQISLIPDHHSLDNNTGFAVINDVKDHCCNRALKLDCKTIKINFDFTSDLFLMPILMILQNSENIAYLEISSPKQKKILIYRPDDLSIFSNFMSLY